MALPKVKGLDVLELHNYGGCGQVYRAIDASGQRRALKVFDDLSVSRALLAKMSQRLQVDGWPTGVVPILWDELKRSPIYQVMPWLADAGDDGSWRPRSLQHRIDSFPEDGAWEVIKSLAHALGQMHMRHVPHGNLKPGNVFFDEAGQLLVSDWCLGNMPGVHVFHFTDALLYQPPEQLLDTSGYLDEQGYGWDVFAFGVIAFRLLTGEFPRCHKVFRQVAPPEGDTRCEGLKGDPERIAGNLSTAQISEWPNAAKSSLEERMREWIMRCLSIDPAQRPVTMMEVCAGFGLIEKEVAEEDEHLRLLGLIRKSRQQAKALLVSLGLAVFAVVILTVWWRDALALLDSELATIDRDRTELQAAAEGAQVAEQVAKKDAAEARRLLAEAQEEHLERLEASRLIGDHLFDWAMEKGRRRLPALDGRQLRLARLETYFQEFLKQSSEDAALRVECARVQLQLAEIAIAQNQVVIARERFERAQEAWDALAMDGAMKFRMATDSLLIAMLRDARSDPAALAAYEQTRTMLDEVPSGEVDADRLDQLVAVLEFREAKLLIAAGKDQQALEQLMRATKTLNRISAKRPDVAILRSALADCYLSSAVILDGVGSLGDAREVRLLASQELAKLHADAPDDLTMQFDLASCYSAMADAAVLSGDVEGAVNRSKQALALLEAYLNQRPRDDEAMIKKAALLGLQAGVQRDQGKAVTAMKLYDEAMGMLEAVHDREPEHAVASYHLALIWWQKGRMLGIQDSGGDVAMMDKASLLMSELAEAKGENGLLPQQLKRSRAYIAGDLGHAFELKGQKDKARLAFNDAVQRWRELHDLRPRSEEYLQGLEWCRQRLKDLQ